VLATLEGPGSELSVATARRTERAAAAVVRAGEHLPSDCQALARLLLRAEGVASSEIEGLQAPPKKLRQWSWDGRKGRQPPGSRTTSPSWRRHWPRPRTAPLSIETLPGWHERLMRHDSRLPADWVGGFRSALGWVGGPTPLAAAYGPPPPERVATLMDDLVRYANREDIDPITQAAVAHAQFETIHPYADGNGRIGRVLVGWLLAR